MEGRINALFLAVVVVVIVITSSQAASATASSTILDVVLSDQSPYPVSPGGTVTIEVQFQNTGFIQASDIVTEIIAEDPFNLLPGEEQIQTLATIPGRGSRSLTYRLSVDSEAPTSTYPVKFRIYEGSDATGYEEESIDINVLGEANLILDDLDTIPQTLEPGAIADAVIKIKNIGTGAAKDLELTLNSSHDEIKPILAKGRVYVGDIGPGETMTAALGMSIGSGAEEKTYIVTIGAEYRDESNSDASTAFSVGFPVEGTINLDIIKKEANYERNTLRIEVANKGTTEAKSLEARLVIDNETVGIDYISSLKANKKTTFEFPLALVGSGQLVMDFIGPGIEKNQVTKDVVLSYEQPSSTDGTGIIVVLIVLVIVVYLLYRKFLRKGHHHKKE